MKKIHVIVKGKVQGVFFRAYTKSIAIELKLHGHVKNLDNGSVEIIAEGDEKNLLKFIEYCKKGPESSNVKNISVEYLNPVKEYSDFQIRY